MRIARLVALGGLVFSLGVPAAFAQVQANPNQIDGSFHFSNTNPEALAILQQFPIRSGQARATHPTLGSALTDLVPEAGGGATFELSVQATPEGASHELTLSMSIASNFDPDSWSTVPLMSPPVHPEPAPDVVVDIAECAAIVRLIAVDQAGVRVPWPYATVTSTSGSTMRYSRVNVAPMEDYLILPVVPDPWDLRFSIANHQDVTTTVGPVGCDEIAEVQVTLVPSPGPGAPCSVIGQFDLVGEVESARRLVYWETSVSVQEGDRFDYTAAPASGPFQIDDVVSDRTIATAKTSLRNFNGYQELELDSEWFDCPDDSVTDLGTMLVIEPGSMRGDIFFAGPPETPTVPSALRFLVRPTSREEGVLTYGIFNYPVSKIAVAGTGSPLWSSLTRGLYEGAFNPATAAFEGTFDLVVGAPLAIAASYAVQSLDAVLARDDEALPYLGNTLYFWDRLSGPVAIPNGSAVTRDQRYCLSEVEVMFETTSGLIESASIFARGDMVGTDFEGDAVDYDAIVTGASRPYVDPAPTTSVRMLLPEAVYTMRPSMDILSPGGVSSSVTLPEFPLTVGCREYLRLYDTLQVRVTSGTPQCVAGPLAIQGSVLGGSTVARLAWRLGSGPDSVLCEPCGVDPVFDFLATPEPGQNEIVVEATDASGRRAHSIVVTRFAPEPGALDRDPAAAPLRVERLADGSIHLTWEREALDLSSVHRGTLDSLWLGRAFDHVRIRPCNLGTPEFIDRTTLPRAYYLVTAGCGEGHGSYGRDSFGVERPRSPSHCP